MTTAYKRGPSKEWREKIIAMADQLQRERAQREKRVMANVLLPFRLKTKKRIPQTPLDQTIWIILALAAIAAIFYAGMVVAYYWK